MIIVELGHEDEKQSAGMLNRLWRLAHVNKNSNSPQLPGSSLRPPLSERWANAKDEVAELENKLAVSLSSLHQVESDLKAERIANADLRKENTYLADNRDKLLRDNARLATILSTIDDVIVNAMKKPEEVKGPIQAQEVVQSTLTSQSSIENP